MFALLQSLFNDPIKVAAQDAFAAADDLADCPHAKNSQEEKIWQKAYLKAETDEDESLD